MTSAHEPIDGTVVEDDAPVPPVHALVPRSTGLAVMPSVKADELVARLAVIRDAMDTAMQEGVDYGRIPGIDKPTLFKPGAEKLGVLFQLDIQLDNQKIWGPDDHLTVNSHATVFHAPSGTRLGFGEGLCTTRERKYAKRQQERLCPACGKPSVIKGKAEYGAGWLCWKKRDGCGAKYQDGDPAIEGQEVGEIDNPDLPDLYNTVIKMAAKRARVDAVLAVTGASALFTQDIEDAGPVAEEDRPVEQSAPAPAIDGERASALGLLIHEAMQAGVIDPGGLSTIFTAAGAVVTQINRAAVAGLTPAQADEVEQRVRNAIGAA